MEQAARGAAALKASKYADAVTLYTEAIKQQSAAANHYIQRSIANQRISNFQDALSDADNAVLLAAERQRRELIGQAQLRRAIALFSLERYADAQFVMNVAKRYNDKDNSIPIWESKITSKLENLAEGDPATVVSVTETPEKPKSTTSTQAATKTTASTAPSTNEQSKPTVPILNPSQIRHEWYQNHEYVYISLLAKGLPRQDTAVDITSNSISISFPLPSGSSYDFSLDPLFAPIDQSASSSAVLTTKVELTLKKASPGHKWPSLEGTSITTDDTSSTTATVPATAMSSDSTTAPVYPTSSRTGPKNWDKIVNDMTRKSKSSKASTAAAADDSTDAKDEKADDKNDNMIDDDDDEGGDEVNAFFKKLYRGADPDTRRAMIKSYQESNGTALSTNWAEVGKGKVETSPPDGMEAKTWGS